MNIVEKIIARHAFVKAGQIGVQAVKRVILFLP